jgi:hypothetical protein
MTQSLDIISPSGETIETSWSSINTTIINNNGGLFADGKGTCVPDSLRYWVKLAKAGATRMRGQRSFGMGIHYWVENKGKVFDISGNKLTICKTDEYYANFEITNIETAPYSGLFIDEVKWIIDGNTIKEEEDSSIGSYLLTTKNVAWNVEAFEGLVRDKFYERYEANIHLLYTPLGEEYYNLLSKCL